MALHLKSKVFEDRAKIPSRFTGEGEDVSPPLEWSGAPAQTKQFALVCDDPDAPSEDPFVHWLVYNISGQVSALSEQLASDDVTQGENSFGRVGYGGPMPPKGHGVHHYQFKLYALSEKLDLPEGLTKEELLKSIEGKILQESLLVGTYERK